jgi:hypothetical protein
MDNIKYVLNLDITDSDSSTLLTDTFKMTKNFYKEIFDTVSETEINNLSIMFLVLNENDFEFSLIALIEAINLYCETTQKKSFKKLTICSFDLNALKMFRDYLENGYEKSILNEFNSTQCFKCDTYKFILKQFEFHDYDCNFCEFIFQISQIYYKCLSQNENEFICFKCAIKTILNQLQANQCTGCLNEIPVNYLNQYCFRHKSCLNCANTSEICYVCLLMKFLSRFNELNNQNLINNHDKIKCCYDFCDSDSSLEKLKCGHVSECKSKPLQCHYCALFKIFKSFSLKYNVELNELFTPNLTLEEEKDEESENEIKTLSKISNSDESLPGFENHGTITISLLVPDGIQTVNIKLKFFLKY